MKIMIGFAVSDAGAQYSDQKAPALAIVAREQTCPVVG